MRSLYSPVKLRRLASATTSGSGRGGAGGSVATVLPAAELRSASLRSSSLRSAAGKTEGEAEEIPLFFTLIPILALLSNYDREDCLINVGTEGILEFECVQISILFRYSLQKLVHAWGWPSEVFHQNALVLHPVLFGLRRHAR